MSGLVTLTFDLHIQKLLTFAITFEQLDVVFSYFTCLFLVVRPFHSNKKIWPCDLDRDHWLTCLKTLTFAISFEPSEIETYWQAYPTYETLSNDTRSLTLTVAFILKLAVFNATAFKCRRASAIPRVCVSVLASTSTFKMLWQMLKSWNFNLCFNLLLYFNFCVACKA